MKKNNKTEKPSSGKWMGCHGGDCQCGSIFGHDGEVYIGTALGELYLREVDPVPSEEQQRANARLFIHSKSMYLLLKNLLKTETLSEHSQKKMQRLIDQVEGKGKRGTSQKTQKLHEKLKDAVNKNSRSK